MESIRGPLLISSAYLLRPGLPFPGPWHFCPCLSPAGPLRFLAELVPCQQADQKEGDGEGPGLKGQDLYVQIWVLALTLP